jgi:CheY-like chemotaxis protein
MAAVLEETGATLKMAATGSGGLQQIDSCRFDLALLDLQLPDMSGTELAQAVRSAHPELPMIAVTAQASTAAVDACHAAGMESVVLKPVEPAELFEAMARALGEKSTPGASTAQLEEIFGANPERLRQMYRLVSDELFAHRRELESAFAGDDLDTIRATRHKLHSAIEQLELRDLREALDQVADGDADDDARDRCLEMLAAAARVLAAKAQAS